MTRKKIGLYSALVLILAATFFTSCTKDRVLTSGGKLTFSRDTLSFDTVFTAVGSVTRSFKVFNKSERPINISSIRLASGDSSFFRLNINGAAVKAMEDIELATDDSIYVFVAVTVDPNNDANPFVIDDRVLIDMNDNEYEVALQAYGQNAHYIDGETLMTQTWINDLPYVIVNSALVDSNEVLTIQAGCRIYVNANSTLFVGGRMLAFGTKADSIIFQGDRLDRDYFGYEDYPGEWGGIYFTRTAGASTMNYCVVKNAGARFGAVYVTPPSTPQPGPQLTIKYSIIANSLSYGLIGLRTWIVMENCLIHKCGLQNLAFLEGGNYTVKNCTFANFGGLGIKHTQDPVLAALNYRDISQTQYFAADLNATFDNCIIFGSLENECFFNERSGAQYNLTLNHCIIKQKDPLSSIVTDVNVTRYPNDVNAMQFVDRAEWDFHLSPSSPAKGAGTPIIGIIDDLDGNSRNNPPSVGCYE